MPNVDQSVEQLFHKVKILGTDDEASYFTLICPYPKDSGMYIISSIPVAIKQ